MTERAAIDPALREPDELPHSTDNLRASAMNAMWWPGRMRRKERAADPGPFAGVHPKPNVWGSLHKAGHEAAPKNTGQGLPRG